VLLDLPLFVDHASKNTLINLFVETCLPSGKLRLYEAGGGSKTIFSETLLARAEVVLVDISPEKITATDYADETIVGNIEEWSRPHFFDIVCCNNVLEHVDDAAAAIEMMTASLRPGGLLVIAGPVPTSLQGWVTRLSPHAVHVWFYRHVLGAPKAGAPGHGPFPVKFSFGSHLPQLLAILAWKNFDVAASARYPGTHTKSMLKKSRLLAFSYFGMAAFCKAATFGIYQPLLTDFFIVARKSE